METSNTLCLHSVHASAAIADAAVFPTKERGKPQARRLLDKHEKEGALCEEDTTELDRERADLMRRNKEMLAKIGVTGLIRRKIATRPAMRDDDVRQEDGSGGERRTTRPKRVRGVVEPVRRSTRRANAAAAPRIADVMEDEAGGLPKAAARGAGITTQEEYLASKGLPLPEGWFRSDGRFKGWVQADVAMKYGLASSAAEAWDLGGGGKFQHKIKKSDVPTNLKAKGWSDARAFAASQLHKNPNAYFYRHTAPGEQQAQGEWTEDEHNLFVETARKYGVGDKWGLFASYIPNRVGYQCSAYYTQVIVPSGLILDARFRMDSWGDAVYMGPKGTRGGGDE
uniref:MYB-like DNA-binding protein n=1 Tax=Yamagishiella unicocca TaxID=51707 RepID=A0A2Z5X8C0_9CHLO|nr:MYB-like DNA-binding protein [Yamagishiella unicocca]